MMKKDKPLPRMITREWLNACKACEEQADLFEKIWPEGGPVNQETLTSAARAGLDLEWFAEQILPGSFYCTYLEKDDTLRADYLTARRTLSSDYHTKLNPLYDDYHAKRDILYSENQTKCDALYSEYEDYVYTRTEPFYAEYKTRRALLYTKHRTALIALDTENKAARDSLCPEYETERGTLLVTFLWDIYEKEAS